MKRNKLAVLCDYGLDDAVATCCLLEHSEQFAQIDLVPVGGNFPLKTSFDNAKRLLARYGHVKNVRLVDTSSLPQPFETLCHIHGNNGMGDLLPDPVPEIPSLDYRQWVKTLSPEDTVLLSLGPCTVTLDILNTVGPLPLVMMAGNIAEPPNYKGYEFNHGLDTVAFGECVKYPHVTATLDTCHHPLLDFYHIVPEGDSLFCRFVTRAVEFARKRGDDKASIYDLTAVFYLLNPSRFSVARQTDRDGNLLSVLQYTDSRPMF